MADPRLVPPPPAAYADQKAPPPPQQYLSAPDPTNPLANAMGAHKDGLRILDQPTRYPKLGAQAIASLPTDPQAKINYLAQNLFPGASQEMATRRMGISNGRAFYIDYDGQAYYAEPSFDPLTAPGRTLATLPDQVAGAAGPAMETIGGMGGGLLTAEIMGGVPGAAAGGAAGNAARQGLAHVLTGEEKPLTARLMEAGGAALQEGVGQGLGLGLAKTTSAVLNRNPLRVAGYDSSGLTSKRIGEMETAAEKARQMGITVTPGEAGNVTSLLQRQRQLGRLPESSTQINDFYTRRNTQQLPAGWDQVLRGVSGITAPGLGARSLQTGSKEVISDAIATQQKLAGPKYRAVVNDTNLLPEDKFADLMKDDVIKVALKSVRGDKILNSSIKDAKSNSLLVLNETKKKLDSMYNAAKLKLDKNRMRILDDARKDLLATADEAFPEYAGARAAFAGEVPNVEAVTKGLTGLAAKDRASGLQNAPRALFDQTSADPMSITTARNAFIKAGKTDEWNAGLRSYLQNAFDTAAKQDQGPASSLHRALKADARQYANLKAAMTPEQFKSFDDFMNVLEMVKRGPKEGSPTATDLGAKEAFASSGAKALSGAIKNGNPFNIPERLGNWVSDMSAGKNAAAMVGIITSPKAISSLRKLKMLRPGTEKFLTELTYLGSVGGMQSIGGPDDRTPDLLK